MTRSLISLAVQAALRQIGSDLQARRLSRFATQRLRELEAA